MANELEGKVAFITGAAAKRGMGRAVALKFASKGADIVICDKFKAPKSVWPGDENWQGLDEVVNEIESMNRQALAVLAGVENAQEVDKAVEAAIEKFDKIDILVNCVGIRGPVGVTVAEGDEVEWRRMFDINTIGAFNISKAVARKMIKRNQGGKIVHIASAAGREGVPGSAAYAASKWAVIGLVQSLAKELAPYKINVNAINPGFFATNLRDDTAERDSKKAGKTIEQYREEEYKVLANMVPLGRMGTTDDIAKLIFFLVSSESEYMTGQDINLTGGVMMP